jgi:magnesium and cobalt exporter, CNNM family
LDPEPYLNLSIEFLQFIPLEISPFGLTLGIALVAILLFFSALISSSEVAFFSLTVNDLEKITQENSKATAEILKLKDQPRSLLATILISNNFINIAIVVVSDYLLRFILPEAKCDLWVSYMPSYISDYISGGVLHFMINIIGVTFLLVLFGEVAPKIYAKINNVSLAKFMSGKLLFLIGFFRPVSSVLIRGTNIIERRLSRRNGNGNLTSREDIDQAIELTMRDDKHGAQEMDILKGIVKFGDVSVKQIMRSRVDVVSVDFRVNYRELLQEVRNAGYSRIPIHDEDFDNITGILYVKDLLEHLDEDMNYEWQELIETNIMYVPESKKIDDLLKEFQKNRIHMAIVVDEFGGSSGIVTLEDIMEEVIGEIKDEFDQEEELDYKKIDDYNYIFEGKTLLNDVCRVIGVDTNTFDQIKGESDSLAGVILEIVGHIPKREQEIKYNDYHFIIVSVDDRRIKQIQITLPQG